MRRLPRLIVGTLMVMVLSLFAVQGVDATSITFSSLAGAAVRFQGSDDTFEMRNSDGSDSGAGGSTRDFQILLTDGFVSLIGLLGNITGTFTIGAIAIESSTVQTAPVSGAGELSINDGVSDSFTADLDWVSIKTEQSGPVSFGTINASGTVNLSNLFYSGTNPDLLSLAGFSGAVVVASFSFIPAKNLVALTTEASNSAAYLGTLSPVPEPAAMFLGGTGLVALAFAARRRLFGL